MPQRRGAARRRVVSLVPAATEIIAALGEADSLVGISHECFAEGLAPCPRVTASSLIVSAAPAEINSEVSAMAADGRPMFTLLADEIEGLHPDLIITQGLCAVCAVSEPDVRALASRLAPTPRVVSISATSLDGVFNDIATVGAALGVRSDAERLLASLRARMKKVHVVLSESRAPRPRVGTLEWTDPLYAAGHWVPEMVYRAGGTDVLAVPGQHSREVTWDAFMDASPAIVLIAPCGYGVAHAAREGRALVEENDWLQRRTVWALDARSLTSQPGPRLVDGIEAMAAIFNPGLFDAPSEARAVALSRS
jgi:iron complex transport system substrate-binding protein